MRSGLGVELTKRPQEDQTVQVLKVVFDRDNFPSMALGCLFSLRWVVTGWLIVEACGMVNRYQAVLSFHQLPSLQQSWKWTTACIVEESSLPSGHVPLSSLLDRG